MAQDEMQQSPEAEWLRRNWTIEILGAYKDKWIAVKGSGVISAGEDIRKLIYETINRNPLYAYVFFGVLQ